MQEGLPLSKRNFINQQWPIPQLPFELQQHFANGKHIIIAKKIQKNTDGMFIELTVHQFTVA